jgi:histidine triad (HIT) family protein
MKDCLFCKIAKKEIKSMIVKETNLSLAFLDIKPLTPGHTLVIPKRHRKSFSDLKNDEILDFYKVIKNVMNTLRKKLKVESFTLGVNDGRHAGQTISHLHFHIIPRYPEDKGGSIHSIVNFPPENLEEIYDKIKK